MTEQTSSATPDGIPPRRPSKWRTRGRISPALWFAVLVVYPVSSLLFRLRYRNGERIPPCGPVLLVANHVSILDPLA